MSVCGYVCVGGWFGYRGSVWASGWKWMTTHAYAVVCEEGSEVVGVLDSVQSKEEPVLAVLFRSQQVFHPKELPFFYHCQNALMGIGAGKPGELVARLHRYANASGAAECDELFQPLVPALTGDTDVVELA